MCQGNRTLGSEGWFRQHAAFHWPNCKLSRDVFISFVQELMARAERANVTGTGSPSASTSDLFWFQVEERIQCAESGQVRGMTAHAASGLRVHFHKIIGVSNHPCGHFLSLSKVSARR